MRITRFRLRAILGGVMALSAASLAPASIYNANSAVAGTGNDAADLTSVQVTNDSQNLTFTINLTSTANLQSNHYVNYEIGIQTGVGSLAGQTAVSNPYGSPIGISTGMYDWIPAFVFTNGSSEFVAGAQMYQWNGSSLAQNTGTTAITSTAVVPGPGTGSLSPSITIVVPLANFGPSGLVPGNSFNFDVWTTYGSEGAYDALDQSTTTDPNPGTTDPWNNYPYDSATFVGSTLNTYTVTATPEPMSIAAALLSSSMMALLARRRPGRPSGRST